MRPILLLSLASALGPVAKVIQLLDELSKKVTSNGDAELAEFNEFRQWCDSERRTKERSISTAKRSVNDLSATVESSKAAIDQLEARVSDLSQSISADEDEVAKAEKLRKTEKAQFETTDAELTETVDTLIRAQTVLQKHSKEASLIEVKANLRKMTQSLMQIVRASWVNTEQKSIIEDFLQKGDDNDDLSLSLVQQPQASTSNYESHGSGLISTLTDLQEKAEAAQSEARREEMEAAHAYQLLTQSLTAELKAQQKQLEDAKKRIASNREAQHEADGDLSSTQRTLDQDVKVLAELKMTCQEKAQDFEQESRSRAEELKALSDAKAVLVGYAGGPTFLQFDEVEGTEEDEQEKSFSSHEATKQQALQYLQQLSHKLNSPTLAQVAVSLGGDPFGKVKGMIEDLIAKLMAERSEAMDRKSWCDQESQKTLVAQNDKQAKLEVSSTRIEKAEAATAKLSEAISNLQRELAAMDAGQAEATKLRQEEHANFLTAVQDYHDGQEACAGAISVLRNYYEGGESFIETPNAGAAHSIIGLLEVAESDFSRMEADARAAESAAQQAYDKQKTENEVSRAATTTEIHGKEDEVKRLSVQAGDYKADRQGIQNELAAVVQYSEKLSPECETTTPSYAEREGRRKAELEGLKTALEILEGRALALLETHAEVRRTRLRGAEVSGRSDHRNGALA
jgi:hypothetical protein